MILISTSGPEFCILDAGMNDRAVSFSGTWDWSTVPAGLAPGVKKVGPASVYEKQAVKSIEIREPLEAV